MFELRGFSATLVEGVDWAKRAGANHETNELMRPGRHASKSASKRRAQLMHAPEPARPSESADCGRQALGRSQRDSSKA
jgi:hypothetical protein